MKYTQVSEHIVQWLKQYAESNNIEGYVIGVSGGIDSSVVSTLCAKTGLPLMILEMPIHQLNDTVGNKHINFLKTRFKNVESIKIDLTSTFDIMKNSLNLGSSDKANLALANTRSRLRMAALYSFATMRNSVVCGTGNKVEDFGLFFYSKGGDGMVDVSPIGDLMKSEVYALGAELDLIPEVLNAIPTDGLWEGSPTDEEQLKGTYDEFEWAMAQTDGMNLRTINLEEFEELVNNISKYSKRQKEVMKIYFKRHKSGLHKSLPIPVCIIPDNMR